MLCRGFASPQPILCSDQATAAPRVLLVYEIISCARWRTSQALVNKAEHT